MSLSLLKKYHKEVIPQLQKELRVKSPLAVPRIIKVVVSVGVAGAKDDKKILDLAGEQLMVITGQKPKVCRAKKSIAGFKLGKSQPIGLAVTLRRERAFTFLEKLFRVVLPRVKDFNGVNPKSFDGSGNYNLGVSEQIVFSEIDFAKVDKIRGLEITIVTNAKNDKKARLLLEKLGMPFARAQG